MTRNLQLARRETFFNDPFFADIMSLQDSDMHKKLDVFKQKSLLGIGKGEAAHNLQVTASNDKFMPKNYFFTFFCLYLFTFYFVNKCKQTVLAQ